jgi:hypothetical protein
MIGRRTIFLYLWLLLGYLLWDKDVARTFSALVVHQANITISTLVKGAQRFGHTSGSSAPSMTFPTPSMILYVGSCFPSSVETALKKWGLCVIGDCKVGNRPWLSGKETGVVVYKPLRNMRERANKGRVQIVRIIWRGKQFSASPHVGTRMSQPGWSARSHDRMDRS